MRRDHQLSKHSQTTRRSRSLSKLREDKKVSTRAGFGTELGVQNWFQVATSNTSSFWYQRSSQYGTHFSIISIADFKLSAVLAWHTEACHFQRPTCINIKFLLVGTLPIILQVTSPPTQSNVSFLLPRSPGAGRNG